MAELVGPGTYSDGANVPERLGRTGEVVVTGLHGDQFEQAKRGNVFVANAIVTAPVIFSTAAATGGPLLYNGSTTVNAVILGVSFGVTTASTVPGSIGLTGGPTTAPTSTTAIDSKTNGFLGGSTSQATAFRVGTVSAAGTFFYALGGVDTAALTAQPASFNYIDLEGRFIVPPGYFISVAGSATLSTLVANIGLIWEEVPING